MTAECTATAPSTCIIVVLSCVGHRIFLSSAECCTSVAQALCSHAPHSQLTFTCCTCEHIAHGYDGVNRANCEMFYCQTCTDTARRSSCRCSARRIHRRHIARSTRLSRYIPATRDTAGTHSRHRCRQKHSTRRSSARFTASLHCFQHAPITRCRPARAARCCCAPYLHSRRERERRNTGWRCRR